MGNEFRGVIDREASEDQLVLDVVNGVALSGTHQVGAVAVGDLEPILLVVVDYVDDLRLSDPLVPETWGLQKVSHSDVAVFLDMQSNSGRRMSKDLREGFGNLLGSFPAYTSWGAVCTHPVLGPCLLCSRF